MGQYTTFATDSDMNFCCHIPKVFPGIPCNCCDFCCNPCYGAPQRNRTVRTLLHHALVTGMLSLSNYLACACAAGSIVLVNPQPPCFKSCCTPDEWYLYATRPGPCVCCCGGPASCTFPFLTFIKDAQGVKEALNTALKESLEHQATTYTRPGAMFANMANAVGSPPPGESMAR